MTAKSLTTKEFIEKANLVHSNKYNYSKTKYITSQKKIIIGCAKHGFFKQTPNSHLNKSGCPGCGEERRIKKCTKHKSNTEDFINKANKINNTYDYTSVQYINAKTPVIIICNIHGKFKRTPNDFLNGIGCPVCGKQKAVEKITKTTQTFVKEATIIHNQTYDYRLVEYVGAHKKVTILCPTHGAFKQTPSSHLQGTRCPKCAHENHPGGYSETWFNNRQRRNIKGIFYLLKFSCKSETFLKIGITQHNTQQRYAHPLYKFFNIEPLKILNLPLFEAYQLEQQILKTNYKWKYWPKHTFYGKSECFSTHHTNDLLKRINTFYKSRKKV